MMDFLIYLLVGSGVGILAGLFGVGGGLIIVPALVYVFAKQGITDTYAMHLAIGTSLATIVVTSISSVIAHHRRGAVNWSVVWQLVPGLLLGGLLGAYVADGLDNASLKTVFALFEILVGVYLFSGWQPGTGRWQPGNLAMAGFAVLIGCVSAIVGIGGGTMTVPLLIYCKYRAQEAVGTSSAAGLFIAISGATGFMLMGYRHSAMPELSIGYIYVPAFVGIIITSVLFAPIGAKIAHSLPAGQLKRIFAVFLLILGAYMLFYYGKTA